MLNLEWNVRNIDNQMGTSVHSRLQAHEQVGEPGLPGARQVFHVAPVFLEVALTGLGQ